MTTTQKLVHLPLAVFLAFILSSCAIQSGATCGNPGNPPCFVPGFSPNDRLMKGPFTFSTEWQTIEFEKPIRITPHIYEFEMFLNGDLYESVTGIPRSDKNAISFSYRLKNSETTLFPDVVLIDKSGKVFKTSIIGTGWRKTPLGVYNIFGFGIDAKNNQFYFPKGTEFVAVKIRSNLEMRVEHLSWYDYSFSKGHNPTWEKITDKQIAPLQNAF